MKRRLNMARARDDAGFALVEVIVSAAILVGVALATFMAVDAAQSTATKSRDRSLAASLAELDQERMRSLPAAWLANHPTAAADRTVNGVTYTVTSAASWMYDATGGTPSCTSDTQTASYLKISSTVVSKTSNTVGTKINPVTITSIMAPPLARRGTLAVSVRDSRDLPVPNIGVSITGPTGMSDTTNSVGCAFFSYIPSGTYHVLLNQAGWVDPSGATALDFTKPVTDGSLSTVPVVYDRAGTATVTFDTLDTNGTTVIRSRGWAASGANTGIPGGLRTKDAVAPAPQASVQLDALFPFTTGYQMFSGACAATNPATAIPSPNWYTTRTPTNLAVVPQGGTLSTAIQVRQPPLKVKVLWGTTAMTGAGTANNAHVVLDPTDAACGTGKLRMTTTSTGTIGLASKTPFDFGAGLLSYDPGVPFGAYTVCVDATNSTATAPTTRSKTLSVNVNAATGAPASVQNVDVSTGYTSGACP